MKPRILLINPPIYDFSAYDFWLQPYGLLRVAGWLRGQGEFRLFDFLDRLDSRVPPRNYRADPWGRGEYYKTLVVKPAIFADIRRRYRRYGLPKSVFAEFLAGEQPFDYAMVQTGMTYWYPGVREVIEELRRLAPRTKVILGGVYATLCASHARTLGADLVVERAELSLLWRFLSLQPQENQLPFWDLYPRLTTGVLKLTDGCPFRCTYCSVPQLEPKFRPRSLERSVAELEWLVQRGAKQVAFYDDALLFQREQILQPFLEEVLRRGITVNFHTPNALNARFITPDVARLMIGAGFKKIYLGFESSAYPWQKKTGGKVYSEELAWAIQHLVDAGAARNDLHAYIIIGHPQGDEQEVESSIRYASSLGIKIMLSDFSPIPGTPDGDLCRQWIDLDEPLTHNKIAFTSGFLGQSEVDRLKNLTALLNQRAGLLNLDAPGTAVRSADRLAGVNGCR